jgi:hypothetical protein
MIAEALAGCRSSASTVLSGAIALTLHRAEPRMSLTHAQAGRASWGWLADRPRGRAGLGVRPASAQVPEGERVACRSTTRRGDRGRRSTLRLTIDPADIVLEPRTGRGALRRP